MKPVPFLQGAGIAALVLFPVYGNVIDSPSDLRMHTSVPVTTFVLAIVANLVLASFCFALLRIWLHGKPKWRWLKLLLPGLVLASLAEMIYITWIGFGLIALWLAGLATITCIAVLLHWRWQAGEKRLLQSCDAILSGLGIFCMFVVLQLLYLATWRPLPNSTQYAPATTASSIDHPRVVWILFDEMSYDQVFGHRYPGLQLPNFDEFRQSSTVFTDTRPVVNETEKAIPSMLLGQYVDRVDYTSGNRLKVGIGKSPLRPFDAAQTPFALAHRAGLTTGVVGWYNPYCGVLAPYLSACYWTDEIMLPSVFAGESFLQNLADPWIHYWRILFPDKEQKRLIYRARVYRDLMRHADSMLQPDGPDFLFLHLPLPHPPAFYNRKTQQFDTSGDRSYLDSLALADKTLGQVLAILQRSPRWKNTSVVICGDHSWRVYTWSHFSYWTAEDQAASHNRRFDPRPLIMVHQAGQQTPATVTAPYPLQDVHSILDDLIDGNPPSFPSAAR